MAADASPSIARVLYVDWVGHPAPLSECYLATASRRVSSSVDRHVPSTVTSVESAYCVHCLAYQNAAFVGRSPFCPKPTCLRCPLCLSPANVTAVSSSAPNENSSACVYRCGGCDWSSQECGLIMPVQIDAADNDGTAVIDRLELARSAEELFTEYKKRKERLSKALDGYFEALRSFHNQRQDDNDDSTYTAAHVEPWSLQALEASLDEKKIDMQHISGREGVIRLSFDSESPDSDEASLVEFIPSLCYHLQSLNSCIQPLARQDLLPVPNPLRLRLTRRCRSELQEGRTGILCKPKMNPLDSGMNKVSLQCTPPNN
jgi:dynactin-4